MTSEKSYATEQRLNGLVPRVGTAEASISSLQSGAGWLTNSPPVYDSWQDTGGLANGWGKGTGYWKFVHILPRLVLTIFDGLTVGTDTDTTTVLTSANGFPTGYRPPDNITIAVRTDNLRQGTFTYEGAGFVIATDGSVTCRGFQLNATVASGQGLFPTTWF